MISFSPPPEVDSPDLSDEEIAQAIPTGTPQDIADEIKKPCPTCGSDRGKDRVSFRKLRRGPHFYSRVTMCCVEGHTWVRLFETTWYLAKK